MEHDYVSGLLYSPMSGLSLRTLKFEERCSHLCHYIVAIDAQFYISSFSLDRWCLRQDYIAWLQLSILYCVMVIIALILILVTCINLWYHDLAVIIIWTWLYLVLCIDVLTETWKFLIYTHWFYPPYGEQRQSFPPLSCLASVGSIISLSSSIHYLPV